MIHTHSSLHIINIVFRSKGHARTILHKKHAPDGLEYCRLWQGLGELVEEWRRGRL